MNKTSKMIWAAVIFVVGAAAGVAGGVFATRTPEMDKVTLQLRWVTQAQFAGYYAAKDLGFYEDLNLDVTINPAGPGIVPAQTLSGGAADVTVEWMASALAQRENGVQMVNIAQPFKRAGMMLACRKDSGIETPADFPGRAIAVWFDGGEYPFMNWMAQLSMAHLLNFSDERLPGRINIVRQGYDVEPILNGTADCLSAMKYNEFGQIIDAGLTTDKLVIFEYEDEGGSLLEDGLYVLEDNLKDPAFVDKMARFVKASMQGWEYVRKDPRGAASIILKNDPTGARQERHQIRMAVQANSLTKDSDGRLDPEAYERTVQILMSAAGEKPVITKRPSGAWTHAVIDKAQSM